MMTLLVVTLVFVLQTCQVLVALLPGALAFQPTEGTFVHTNAHKNDRVSGTPSRLYSASSFDDVPAKNKKKGKILVLGGTGFLGQEVCRRALLEGYEVTSLSRRGLPPPSDSSSSATSSISSRTEYRKGDARQKESIAKLLMEPIASKGAIAQEPYVGVIHCVGLLFDDASGLGSYNRFVSGSGSLPDSESTYDTITRLTAFNAMDATIDYCKEQQKAASSFPFVFTSAAEAGWPDVPGGEFIESTLAPDFLKRYLIAKRAVESRLLSLGSSSGSSLRPVIVRPSLIYTLDRPASFPSVGAFFVGNRIGLPFVDRPVTVQNLATAMVKAIGDPSVRGILRYPEIDRLSS